MVDLLCIFSEHRQNRSKTEAGHRALRTGWCTEQRARAEYREASVTRLSYARRINRDKIQTGHRAKQWARSEYRSGAPNRDRVVHRVSSVYRR